MSPSPASERGLTLIELLVTLSIAVVLITIAVPGFQAFFQRNRVQSAGSELVAALNLARSEAIRQGARVSVCGSADPSAAVPACGENQWQNGYVVFFDADGDGQFDENDDEVLRTGVHPTGLSVIAGSNIRRRITYTATGRPAGVVNDTLRIRAGSICRDLIINNAGRVRVEDVENCT